MYLIQKGFLSHRNYLNTDFKPEFKEAKPKKKKNKKFLSKLKNQA